jgi:ubiquinone/menaquinone biosynthesis C-methylase UbiE
VNPVNPIDPASAKNAVRSAFGANAAAYAISKVHAQGASLQRLVELAQPQPHWRALDVATAAGHTAFAVAPHVARVIATDITPEMLAEGRKLAAAKSIVNVTFETADAEALPYPAGSFELVTCRIAPHHFPNVAAFVAECFRVLTPGGLCLVVDNVAPAGPVGEQVDAFERLRDPSHIHCLSSEAWVALFVEAGFTQLQWEEAPKLLEFDDWADRMQVTGERRATLRTLIATGPGSETFLRVHEREGKLHFFLSEMILAAHKPS